MPVGSAYSSDYADLNDHSIRKAVEYALYRAYGRTLLFGDGGVPGLSGTGPDNIIQFKEQLAKGPGQEIGFSLVRHLEGSGVSGDIELENREVPIKTADFKTAISQHRHGVRSQGRVHRQTVSWDFLEEALPLLAHHAATMDEIWFFNQVCGNEATSTASWYYTDGGTLIDPSDTTWTGLNAVQANDSEHRIVCSTTTTKNDEDLVAADYFDRTYILDAVNQAEQYLNSIRPVNIGGEDKRVIAVHKNVMRRLRNTDTTWYDLMKTNLQGSNATKAWKAFTGRLAGEFEGCLILPSQYVTPGFNSSTKAPFDNTWRNTLLGAQSCVKAYGRETPSDSRMGIFHGNRDHGDKLLLSYFRVCGMEKTQFDDVGGTARDHAVIVMPSYATRPSITS